MHGAAPFPRQRERRAREMGHWRKFNVSCHSCAASGGLLAPRVHHVSSWNKLWGKGHSLVPWLPDAGVLATLGGRDDGGRHPITIRSGVGDSDDHRKP